jgi:hypothetical protein
VGFLNDAGYLKLRGELPSYLKAIFVIGYHVGARLGELLSLRWKQVDLANSQIVLDPGTTKNEKGRTLPIYGDHEGFSRSRPNATRNIQPALSCSPTAGTESRSFAKPGHSPVSAPA